MSQPIKSQGGHVVFPIGPKNTNLVEDVEILLPIKFHWIPFSGFRGEVENVLSNQRPGRPSCFSDRPEKTQTYKRTLRSCFLSSFVEFRLAVSEEKSKMSQPIRSQGGHLVFPIGPKNTNLVEDDEILLRIKFRWFPFSGFRGAVENVSANQRPGRPSCFSDRPEKHKLGRRSWDLASCQVSLNSIQRFQRRSRKCEKLTPDGRRTTDNAWSQKCTWAFGSGILKSTAYWWEIMRGQQRGRTEMTPSLREVVWKKRFYLTSAMRNEENSWKTFFAIKLKRRSYSFSVDMLFLNYPTCLTVSLYHCLFVGTPFLWIYITSSYT